MKLPNIAEDYVHRIGRTGRAGMEGHAISLVCAEEQPLLLDVEKPIKQILPREEFDGFRPQNPVAMTTEAQISKAPKKTEKAEDQGRATTDCRTGTAPAGGAWRAVARKTQGAVGAHRSATAASAEESTGRSQNVISACRHRQKRPAETQTESGNGPCPAQTAFGTESVTCIHPAGNVVPGSVYSSSAVCSMGLSGCSKPANCVWASFIMIARQCSSASSPTSLNTAVISSR